MCRLKTPHLGAPVFNFTCVRWKFFTLARYDRVKSQEKAILIAVALDVSATLC